MMNHQILNSESSRKSRVTRDAWLEQLLQVRARDLSGAAKLAGICVAIHLDPETGRCELSREAIAERCGMDTRSCRRMIKHLEDGGWLHVRRSIGFFANSFELSTPDSSVAVSAQAERTHHV